MSSLPYITAPGNIERALVAIKAAATPESVSQDFVKTILGIKGGSGNQVTSFLKKVGFAGTDGKPTEIYTKFRNPQSSGSAVFKALKNGYAPLYNRNEFMHKLDSEALKGLIIEETGLGEDSNVPGLIIAGINSLKKFASYDEPSSGAMPAADPVDETGQIIAKFNQEKASPPQAKTGVGLNLSYTINLNLPATPDITVFNAIFKSLKENLLRGDNE